MQEAQRLAYLNALGITQYVPLAPIAGALVLPDIPWDDVVDAGVPAQDVALANIASADRSPHSFALEPVALEAGSPETAAPASVQEAVQQVVDKSRSVAPATRPAVIPPTLPPEEIPQLDVSRVKPEAPAVAPRPKAPATATRFALGIVTLPDVARLVFELGLPDAPGFSAQEHRIVSDILLALNARTELNDSITKLFRWPMVNNPRIAADVSAARDALIAFLAGAQEGGVVPATLFFGTVAASCLHASQPGDVFQLPESGGRNGVTHSLKALQHDGKLKADVWRHLQMLLPVQA